MIFLEEIELSFSFHLSFGVCVHDSARNKIRHGRGERIRTVGEARLATKSEEGGVEEKIEDLAKRYTIGEAISFTIEAAFMLVAMPR